MEETVQKKRRIMTVMQAVCKTPPSGAKKKAAPSKADKPNEAAQETEDSEGLLGTTLSEIDRLIAGVVLGKETDDAVVPEILASKMKNIEETSSESKTFDLRHLGGQEPTEEDISELEEFAIAGGYQPRSILFSGVDKVILGCIPDCAGAKIVNTLSKSIDFPKLESGLSSYRKQHITDSLVYSNFKVHILLLFFNSLLLSILRHAQSYVPFVLWQIFLLSKALKLQQEGEDRKIEFVITGLENKIEDLENLLKEKYARLIDRGGSAEARPLNKKKDTQIAEQNKRLEQLGNEFEKSKSTLRDDLNWLGREAEDLKVKVKVKAEKNMKLSEALRSLRDTCFSFVTRCSSRL